MQGLGTFAQIAFKFPGEPGGQYIALATGSCFFKKLTQRATVTMSLMGECLVGIAIAQRFAEMQLASQVCLTGTFAPKFDNGAYKQELD